MKLFGRRRRVPDAPPTYWNSSVVERIQLDAGVDRETAGAMWAELLLFLDVVAGSEEFVSPPPAVDVAWHAFILHTREYERYCRERYGRVIHHQPTAKPDPQAYRRAYRARSSSGTPVDHAIWPVPAGSSSRSDDGPRPGQSGDFAAGAATIGGADLGAQGGLAPGPEGEPSGGDFGESDSSGAGGDSGRAGGDSGSAGGDSGGSSCGGGGCGGGGN